MDLSIVIPIKDEKDNIRRLHERITSALQVQNAECRVQNDLLRSDGGAG